MPSAIMVLKIKQGGQNRMAGDKNIFKSAKNKAEALRTQLEGKAAEALASSRDAVQIAADAAKKSGETTKQKMAEALSASREVVEAAVQSASEVGESVKDKIGEKIADTRNFKSVESLQTVVNVVNEAGAAIKDTSRTIANSAIPDVLAGALGAGLGGMISFAALYGLGSVVGLSAAGITSGLATAGAIVGGGMTAGIFVLAAPVAGLAVAGVGAVAMIKRKQLRQEKERLLFAAVEKHHAIVIALKDEVDATKERTDYLNGLNILLRQAIKDLKADLALPDETEES